MRQLLFFFIFSRLCLCDHIYNNSARENEKWVMFQFLFLFRKKIRKVRKPACSCNMNVCTYRKVVVVAAVV